MQIGDWKLQKIDGDIYTFSKDIQNTDMTDDRLSEALERYGQQLMYDVLNANGGVVTLDFGGVVIINRTKCIREVLDGIYNKVSNGDTIELKVKDTVIPKLRLLNVIDNKDQRLRVSIRDYIKKNKILDITEKRIDSIEIGVDTIKIKFTCFKRHQETRSDFEKSFIKYTGIEGSDYINEFSMKSTCSKIGERTAWVNKHRKAILNYCRDKCKNVEKYEFKRFYVSETSYSVLIKFLGKSIDKEC